LHLKIDLHVHTVYSDGRGSVRDVLKVAERKGLDGLAITDHDTVDGYLVAKSYKTSMLILPGYEITTDAGHILVLGLEETPPRAGLTLYPYERLIEWTKRRGGLAILAHPAAGKIRLKRWLQCKPNAVEVLNASYPLFHPFVNRGLKVASRLKVAYVGGSDAHDPRSVGDAYTIVKVNGDPDEKSVIEAVREGKVKYGGGLAPFWIRFRMGLGYLLSDLIYYARFPHRLNSS